MNLNLSSSLIDTLVSLYDDATERLAGVGWSPAKGFSGAEKRMMAGSKRTIQRASYIAFLEFLLGGVILFQSPR